MLMHYEALAGLWSTSCCIASALCREDTREFFFACELTVISASYLAFCSKSLSCFLRDVSSIASACNMYESHMLLSVISYWKNLQGFIHIMVWVWLLEMGLWHSKIERFNSKCKNIKKEKNQWGRIKSINILECFRHSDMKIAEKDQSCWFFLLQLLPLGIEVQYTSIFWITFSMAALANSLPIFSWWIFPPLRKTLPVLCSLIILSLSSWSFRIFSGLKHHKWGHNCQTNQYSNRETFPFTRLYNI